MPPLTIQRRILFIYDAISAPLPSQGFNHGAHPWLRFIGISDSAAKRNARNCMDFFPSQSARIYSSTARPVGTATWHRALALENRIICAREYLTFNQKLKSALSRWNSIFTTTSYGKIYPTSIAAFSIITDKYTDYFHASKSTFTPFGNKGFIKNSRYVWKWNAPHVQLHNISWKILTFSKMYITSN